MNQSKRYLLLCLLAVGGLFSACNKRYDDHNAINNPLLSSTLLEQISKNADLSKFNEYLVKTGYDKVLASSKSFTVWAPTNAALVALDPTVINTDDKLKLFVGNHIANQLFLTTAIKTPFIRVKTLNGKNVSFSTTAVDGSPLVTKDVYVGNGALNTISTAITPKLNAWDYLMANPSLQQAELNSLTFSFRDLTKAVQISVDPKTGLPVYKAGTGIVVTNRFYDRVLSGTKPNAINNEDSTVTYIILTDAAFQAEKAKLTKYYTLSTPDSTDSLTKFNVIKDLSFRGVLDKDNFPATAYSAGDSVKFHLDKSAVVQTIPVSNGVVYVMSSINYELGNGTYDPFTKIKPIVIQGEPSTFGPTYLASKSPVYYNRRNPDGSLFTEMRVSNPATASFWAKYTPSIANSVQYKVYWRVVRDNADLIPGSKAVPLVATSDLVWFPMRVTFKAPGTVTLPYVNKPGAVPRLVGTVQQVDPLTGKFIFDSDFSEVLLGTYTLDRYFSNTLKSGALGALPVYLVASTTASTSTSGPINDLMLDYIKLVPVP